MLSLILERTESSRSVVFLPIQPVYVYLLRNGKIESCTRVSPPSGRRGQPVPREDLVKDLTDMT
jgi:hypothetical protein